MLRKNKIDWSNISIIETTFFLERIKFLIQERRKKMKVSDIPKKQRNLLLVKLIKFKKKYVR